MISFRMSRRRGLLMMAMGTPRSGSAQSRVIGPEFDWASSWSKPRLHEECSWRFESGWTRLPGPSTIYFPNRNKNVWIWFNLKTKPAMNNSLGVYAIDYIRSLGAVWCRIFVHGGVKAAGKRLSGASSHWVHTQSQWLDEQSLRCTPPWAHD